MSTRIDFERAVATAKAAIDEHVTPGLQVSVRWRDADGRWHAWDHADGALTYAHGAPRVTVDTPYDLASVTKAIVALALVRLSVRGVVDLDATADRYVPETSGAYVGSRTLRALASHRAELPAWRPIYRDVAAADAEKGLTRARVLAEFFATPREPSDGQARYSDVGYVLLGEVIARATGHGLADAVAHEVSRPLGLGDVLHYRDVGAAARETHVAPTEECAWRGRVVQGNVHDENAYALGGVAGHAGLFGTARAVANVGLAALRAIDGDTSWFEPGAMRAMIAPLAGGAHRLGWDGKSGELSTAGSRSGPRTFGHLGFTGTSLWCDPDARVAVALLTNRVHPTRENPRIKDVRVAVHDAVFDDLTTRASVENSV